MTTTPVFEELAATEALRLMAGAAFGRVVFTEDALPAIRPVHFILDGGAIYFRIIASDHLAAALHNTVVAFQSDEHDADLGTGWSVTATGHAIRIDHPAENERLQKRLPQPYAGRGRIFRIDPELVTGRRLAR